MWRGTATICPRDSNGDVKPRQDAQARGTQRSPAKVGREGGRMMRPDERHTGTTGTSKTLQQDQREQTQSARQRAEPGAAPRRAAPSAMLPVSPANAPASPDICARLQPDLKAYVDGQAGWWQRQSIGRHLARCAECRKEISGHAGIQRQSGARADDGGSRSRFAGAGFWRLCLIRAALRPDEGYSDGSRHVIALIGAGRGGRCAAVIGAASLLYPVVMAKTAARYVGVRSYNGHSAPPLNAV